MHEDPTDEVVFTADGHFDWYWAPKERMASGLEHAAKRFGIPADQVKVSPRPICRCCGTHLPRTGVDDVHKRCRKHLMSNPCAISGCSHTRGLKNRRSLHDGTWWLCRDHWRMACPPHSPLRRAYNRFFRTAKKLGIGPNDAWPEQLERRYWRFWMGLIGRARRIAAGDIDMAEINKMFGWEE